MLSWICPDCGCDCVPSDHECPDCSDLVRAGMLALAKSVQRHLSALPPPVEIPPQGLLPRVFGPISPRPAAAFEPPSIAVEPQPASVPRALLPFTSQTELQALSFASQQPPPAPPAHPRRHKIPGWLLSLLVATSLSLGGAAIIRNLAVENKSSAINTPAPQQNGLPQDALARVIEVTGLRIIVDPKHASQLRYIIVNHSPALLSNVALRIAVHSTASPAGAKPLFTVSALITGLAPNESRDVVADIDDLLANDVPAWDRLKPEVLVIGQ
jgi:hypothetical protein